MRTGDHRKPTESSKLVHVSGGLDPIHLLILLTGVDVTGCTYAVDTTRQVMPETFIVA